MRRLSTLFGLVLVLGACGGDGENTTASTTSGSTGQGGMGAGGAGTGGAGTGGGAATCMKTEVKCSDQAILELNLQTDITSALISNMPDGAGFLSSVDATAGGAMNPDPPSYTYGKFTDKGLEKVDISDEQSLDSVDWDIAFRRYVIRINSGSSGPSCVKAGRIADIGNYDKITTLPPNTTLEIDSYFDAMCAFMDDGSGLMNS